MFKLNDKVKLTQLALDNGVDINSKRKIGIVVGFSRTKHGVYVLWEGRKSKDCYHESYLETVPDAP